MASVEEKLAALRQEIDTVDHQLHDLLMRRCELAVKVGEVKAERQPVGSHAAEGAKFIRPAREALILRRLVGRHTGKLPKAVIVRLWRELISALLQVEGPFAVAVFSPDSEPGFWDVARDHYGSRVAVTGFDRVGLVLGAVQDGNATVGIVPLPREDDADPWWRHLIAAGAPHVMGRLPFGDSGNQRGNRVEALVIGRADDVVKVSGHRLSTAEVESALVSHHAVAEAAVVGQPDEDTGQAIAAFVTIEDEYADLDRPQLREELREHVAAKIGKLARPKRIVYSYDLPKTRSGKIMRRLLRNLVEDKPMGDTSSLRDPTIMAHIAEKMKES